MSGQTTKNKDMFTYEQIGISALKKMPYDVI